ncbi:endonuclease/exonuclease/phosphatase family protein [Allorhizobium undicola]|uniref:endonuclease/exonuclease/phosphatase family protein n=1 Tax=Allorhizobium undicola TaxID=78527 RepID=UPI000688A726|nr:endonuclease/exonuclease/phosphatase family protein [Allorhizobium undicola]
MISRKKKNPASFRLMTYNIHGGIGTDRKLDLSRIAAVIEGSQAEIVCLQEVDVNRGRSAFTDQANEIARHIGMDAHFHPALDIAGEKYGDAILTSRRSRLVKAGPLPSTGEQRGALWVEIAMDQRRINVITTHLGLRGGERNRQAAALMGSDWLDHPRRDDQAFILAGDLNAVSRSASYRDLRRMLDDPAAKIARPTFPSRFPILRIDHILISRHLEASFVETLLSPLSRLASDHLPLVADLAFRD